MSARYVLGLSAFYHDSAACLLRDGEIVAAVQEERFTRKKGDAGFPRRAVAYCLDAAGIGLQDLEYIGFYDKPLLKFERILETYLGVASKGFRSGSGRSGRRTYAAPRAWNDSFEGPGGGVK